MHLHFVTTCTNHSSTNRPTGRVATGALISSTVRNSPCQAAKHSTLLKQHQEQDVWTVGVRLSEGNDRLSSLRTLLSHKYQRLLGAMQSNVCDVFLSLCSGLGYILGSSAKVAAGDWHWALRVRNYRHLTPETLSNIYTHALSDNPDPGIV